MPHPFDVFSTCPPASGIGGDARLGQFSERGCVFHHRGHWMLVHAEVQGVLDQGEHL